MKYKYCLVITLSGVKILDNWIEVSEVEFWERIKQDIKIDMGGEFNSNEFFKIKDVLKNHVVFLNATAYKIEIL